MVQPIIISKASPSDAPTADAFDNERERLHRTMLSSVSHDLKTPLASIIGALEVFDRMKDKLSSEKQSTLINVALQEAHRLDSFITNMLDMARLENKMVKIKFEKSEVGSLIRDCLGRIENRLKGSTITIKPSPLTEVETDNVLLARAISLVLDNAIKYGGAPLSVEIEYGQDKKNFAFISIRDNGPGIDEVNMEKIFSKYTRFAREDQQNAGTGLGLAINRAIMNVLGGEILVSNHPDGGAIFTIRIPASKVQAE